MSYDRAGCVSCKVEKCIFDKDETRSERKTMRSSSITGKGGSFLLAVLMVFHGSGCKQSSRGKSKELSLEERVPNGVVAVMGFSEPSLLMRRFAAMAVKADRRFSMMPPETLEKAVLAMISIRYPQMTVFDLSRPFWIVLAVTPQKETGLVAALPVVRSSAVQRTMDSICRPEPGKRAQNTCKIGENIFFWKIEKRFLLFSTNAKALDYLAQPLTMDSGLGHPGRDLIVEVWPDRIKKAWGIGFDQVVKALVDIYRLLRAIGDAFGRKESVFGDRANMWTDRWMDRMARYAADVARAGVFLDFEEQALNLGGSVKARPGSTLAKLIAQGRPGKPVGIEQMPQDCYLLHARRENPSSIPGREKTLKEMVDAFLGSTLSKEEQKGLMSRMEQVQKHWPFDYTIALHPEAPLASPLAATFAGNTKDGMKLRRAILDLLKHVRHASWVDGLLGQDIVKKNDLVAKTGQKLHENRRWDWCKLESKNESSGQKTGLHLAGMELVMVSTKERVLAAFGMNALQRMEKMVESTKKRANQAAGCRIEPVVSKKMKTGWLALSIPTIVKSLHRFKAPSSSRWVQAAKHLSPGPGIWLQWTSDPEKRAANISVRWPMEDMMAVFNFLRSAAQAGVAGDRALTPPSYKMLEDESDL